MEPISCPLKADTFFASDLRVKSRDLSTARQRSILTRIGIASAEYHHQIPYYGLMPLVHPPANISITHGCLPHVIFHKATRLTHGTANLKPAQQSSNGARTGAKCHLMMPQLKGERAGIFPRCHSCPRARALHRRAHTTTKQACCTQRPSALLSTQPACRKRCASPRPARRYEDVDETRTRR